MEEASRLVDQGCDHLEKGLYLQAADKFRQAINLRPDIAELYFNLGQALTKAGSVSEAIIAYQKAIELKADFARAHHELAVIYGQLGRHQKALTHCQRIAELATANPVAIGNLATALRLAGRPQEAIKYARKAIELKPDWADPYITLGLCEGEMNRLEAAVAVFQSAVERFPNHGKLWTNLGAALNRLGRYEEALQTYTRAVSIDGGLAIAHWNRSTILLLQGQLAEGWQEYGWRKNAQDMWKPMATHNHTEPLWDGRPFLGKTLLVHYEQGIGDTIQFVRYVPIVKALGGSVILEVHEGLVGLLGCIKDADLIIPSAKGGAVKADMHVFLLDLPGIFNTTLQNIPAEVPYIQADPVLVCQWRARIPQDRFNIGLAWAGSPRHKNDKNRSCQLSDLRPIFQIPGVRVFGLQKGPARGQIGAHPDLPIIDLGNLLTDWSQTAAALANLDLLISVDTAPLHLAGAMARPVWGLLAFVPDWRWMLDRPDSPWYPTLRLFRQGPDRQWRPVIEQVAAALKQEIGR
jgi:tetratricopeptide (TPR) repeat protein